MKKSVDINRAAYDRIASDYAHRNAGFEPVELLTRQSFVASLGPGRRVLDLGCGPGRDARYFFDEGLVVTGADISQRMLDIARTVAPKAAFVCAELCSLPFTDGSFDGVWCNASLFMVEKSSVGKALEEISRVLSGKGLFFASIKEGQGQGTASDHRYKVEKFYAYYGREEFIGLLSRHGFLVKESWFPLKKPSHTHQWLNFLCEKA